MRKTAVPARTVALLQDELLVTNLQSQSPLQNQGTFLGWMRRELFSFDKSRVHRSQENLKLVYGLWIQYLVRNPGARQLKLAPLISSHNAVDACFIFGKEICQRRVQRVSDSSQRRETRVSLIAFDLADKAVRQSSLRG